MTKSKRARRIARARKRSARTSTTSAPSGAVSRAPMKAVRSAPSLVAGEPAAHVLDALALLRERGCFEADPDGWCRFEIDLPDLKGGPFWRALMRVEAELMLQDAASLTTFARLRTPDERRADAFLLLTRRVYEAVAMPAA